MSTSNSSLVAREERRLQALQATELLDTPPEPLFDLITRLAARAVNVPVVLISLVDSDRQFFKSQVGLPTPWAERRQTPLSHSFCQYVAALGEPLVVEDAREHPLVRDNCAVSELGVIGYAGMPLTTTDGFTLGSLCAIDTKPRHWTASELELLRDFARQVMSEIELRVRIKHLDHDLDALQSSTIARQTETRQLVHDLRTPLNAVYLGLDGIGVTGDLSDDQKACLTLAQHNADVLRDLIQRLIEIGAHEQNQPDLRVRCFPRELADRALDQVAPLAQKAGINLRSDRVLSSPPVIVHQNDLVRVLVNLIANGVKFTARGGEVSVAVSPTRENGTEVVRFEVRDTGIGIAPEDQSRIFREGVRLDHAADPRESSGIGLAFCRRVIEAHGGTLTLQSALGAGSTFSFDLAIDRSAAGAAVDA
jgi:signal transduction histidine kinase